MGDRLEKLAPHGWRVLQSLPVNNHGSDIDNLLIGSGGFWPLNAKNYPHKKISVSSQYIRIYGYSVPYLKASQNGAYKVRTILKQKLVWEPFVRPRIIFLTGTIVPEGFIHAKAKNVEILDRMDIQDTLGGSISVSPQNKSTRFTKSHVDRPPGP